MKNFETVNQNNIITNLEKRFYILGSAAILTISLCLIYLSRRITLDDALIYYRYFRNAINGHGLVYNISESVNALSSPFYTYVGLLFSYIFGDILLTMHLLSGVFLILLAFFLAELLKKQFQDIAFIYLPSLMLVSSCFFYLTFGLETVLNLLLSVMTLYSFFEKSDLSFILFGTMLLLTRGESLFLILILAIYYIVENKRIPKLKFFILPIILICILYGLNYYFYGTIFPTTFSVKINQGISGIFGSYPFLRAGNLLYNSNWMIFPFFVKGFIVILAAIALIGIIDNFKKSPLIQITLFYLISITIFYLSLNIPNYAWYYAPFYMFGFIYFAFGLLALKKILGKKLNNNLANVSTYILGAGFIALLILRSSIVLNSETKEIDYKNIGIWLKNNVERDAKVACIEIGHIGWYSDNYIVDILGLVSTKSSEYLKEKDFSSWYEYYKPDYVVVHNPIWTYESGVEKFIKSGDLIPYEAFNYEGYLLLKPSNKTNQ